MNSYTVLWFDDKFEEYDNDFDTAYLKDIELIGVSNSKEGLKELTHNYDDYDAIIVDGLFYENPEEKGDPKSTAFGKVANKMRELKAQGIVIPWFIYSGQLGFIREERNLIDVLKDTDFGDGKVYDKNNINDFELLCDELIDCVNKMENTIIRNKYQRVFDVCTETYLGKQLKSKVFKMLKVLEKNNGDAATEDLFNPLRKIMETVFTKMSELNLLPSAIIENKGWITGSSLFISNKHSDYKHTEEFIHPLVAHTIHRLLDVIQDASHTEGELRLKVDDYVSTNKSSYIYNSCVYQILEIIIWFKNLRDKFPDAEQNKVLWKKLATPQIEDNTIEGIIEQDASGNYHCGKHLFQYKKIHNTYDIGSKVKVTKTIANKRDTKDVYPYFIIEFQVIENS
ncbi:hypothetical protein [Winogradskyella poriferorum]|uniref:hypothetical protein n=1 Tax=Winogradskyella poriferorum TaxID=307627 RepID=UPI003D64D280